METAVRNNTYFVSSPHSVDQCMNLLDKAKEKGDSYLSKFKFGCMSGDHTSYTFVEAPSEEAARKILLTELQATAKIEKVDVFTSKQIEDLHKTYH
jgi:hypothetical protein